MKLLPMTSGLLRGGGLENRTLDGDLEVGG